MARIYYRIQPPGLALTGHTSLTSEDQPLETGYVFAYTSPAQVIHALREWAFQYLIEAEVVCFWGTDAYDPGDVEGFAVLPSTILGRMDYAAFVHRHGSRDDRDLYEDLCLINRQQKEAMP